MIHRSLLAIAVGVMFFLPSAVYGQEEDCRFICDLEWKVEPTFTVENLANRHRVITVDGVSRRVARERVFETVLAIDMGTKVPRLGFTVESIFLPFHDDNEVELEFESNLHWLTEE
jgi:hypothetical protein